MADFYELFASEPTADWSINKSIDKSFVVD